MAEEAKKADRGFGGTTKALDMFIASLNWLAYKSIYYSLAAKYLKADTFLHPIRHAYQIHWLKKTGAFGHDFTSKLTGALAKQLSISVENVIDNGRSSATSLEIPIFSAWLTQKEGDVRNIIPAALELKKEQNIQDVRGYLREIRIAFDENGIVAANKAIIKWDKQLKKAGNDLKVKYGLKTAQGIQGSFLIKVFNSIGALKGLPQFPELNFNIPLPKFMIKNNSSNFSILFKDITAELVATERLGGVRDLMVSRFAIDDKGCVPPPKTENPQFRNYKSNWKIPM